MKNLKKKILITLGVCFALFMLLLTPSFVVLAESPEIQSRVKNRMAVFLD